VDNDLSSNAVITTKAKASWVQYLRYGAAPATSSTMVDAATNVQYLNRAAYAAANNAPNVNITLKSYLQSIGWTVNSVDGTFELAEWHAGYTTGTPWHRGNDPVELQPKAIVNAFRAGWGKPLLGIEVVSTEVQAVVAGTLGSIQPGVAGSVDIAASMGIVLAEIGGGVTGSVALGGAVGGDLAAMAGTLAASLGEPPNITFTALSTVRIGRTPARMAAKRIGRKRP
jgi:hypothetical protein